MAVPPPPKPHPVQVNLVQHHLNAVRTVLTNMTRELCGATLTAATDGVKFAQVLGAAAHPQRTDLRVTLDSNPQRAYVAVISGPLPETAGQQLQALIERWNDIAAGKKPPVPEPTAANPQTPGPEAAE